jgi:hypothetical protein
MMNHLKILEVLPRGDHNHIVAFVHPSMSALCHEPWSQLFLIPSSPPSMLSLITYSSSTSFYSTSRTEYVRNHSSIAKCFKLSFQRVVIHPDRTPNKRVTPFLLCWCKLSHADFRMCDAQRFGCNFLHVSPIMLILDALERRLNGALEYPISPLCTSLNMCLILMKTIVLLSGIWRCWWSWFQLLLRTHGSDSPCLLNNYNAQTTPEVTARNTHSTPTNHDIPKIFTCGIVNLAKILMGYVCMQMIGWYKNKTMFTPNSKLHAYEVVAKLSIPIEIY